MRNEGSCQTRTHVAAAFKGESCRDSFPITTLLGDTGWSVREVWTFDGEQGFHRRIAENGNRQR